MALFNIKSIAFKWYFFTISSLGVYAEFYHLYMKQLGLNPSQIGMANVFGVQHIFVPLVLLMGDRYRARNLIIWMVTCLCVVSCLLPLLPIVVSLPTCFEMNSSVNSCKFVSVSYNYQIMECSNESESVLALMEFDTIVIVDNLHYRTQDEPRKKSFTTVRKSILKLAELQSLVAKCNICCKLWKI